MENRELEYMSDEELTKLIMDVEENSMMSAPAYLKDEILSQVFEPKNAEEKPVLKQVEDIEHQKIDQNSKVFRINSSSRRISLLVYGAKVMAAAAAAIVLMFAMPVERSNEVLAQEQQTQEEKASVTSQLNEKSNEICNGLFDFSNSLLQPRDKSEK